MSADGPGGAETGGRTIRAVLVDLDDTLYPQAAFLRGAWRAVALAATAWSVDPGDLVDALESIAAEGSDRGRIIDRSLDRLRRSDVPVEPLVRAFLAHRPVNLQPYPGVAVGLDELRRRLPVALVTDGDPGQQEAKLRALGLADSFDAVVCSDHLGRSHRKPDPAPFLVAAAALGVDPGDCVMVGDRPDKDIAGAVSAGLLGAVRVRTGEHQARPDIAGCTASLPDAMVAMRWLCRRLDSVKATSARSITVST